MTKLIEKISELITNKKVLILGFGMEGQSTYKLLKEINPQLKITVADINPPQDFVDNDVVFIEDYNDCLNDFDIIIKSPGIVLEKNPKEYSSVFTSQTELFLELYRNRVIGITGTKGKSTVATLLYHVLSTNNVPCLIAGNIGIPVFDIIRDIKEDTTIVYELSCHQLEYSEYSPSTAIFLNLYEDHLERYKTLKIYEKTKKNIYLHQQPTDILYCEKSVKPAYGEAVSKVVIVNTDILPFSSLDDVVGIRLVGEHNLINCAFVYEIAKTFDINNRDFISALQSYIPLRHRLEFIGKKNDVDYYDDSISTTAESTINAIKSIPNLHTVLLGGMERGINYDKLVDFLVKNRIPNIICMYESGKRIYDALEKQSNASVIIYCKDLYEATETAKKTTPSETACLLSPASASYGDFTNFAERGDVFRRIVFGE